MPSPAGEAVHRLPTSVPAVLDLDAADLAGRGAQAVEGRRQVGPQHVRPGDEAAERQCSPPSSIRSRPGRAVMSSTSLWPITPQPARFALARIDVGRARDDLDLALRTDRQGFVEGRGAEVCRHRDVGLPHGRAPTADLRLSSGV
jgi:hypothetical protein